MTTLEDVLARHPFWNNLPPQYFPLLIECAVIEHFRPGEQIFKKGYDAEHFYLIHQGKVALEMPYVPGRRPHYDSNARRWRGARLVLALSSLPVAFQCAGGRADRSRRLQGGCTA
jgi:hypothetical protein